MLTLNSKTLAVAVKLNCKSHVFQILFIDKFSLEVIFLKFYLSVISMTVFVNCSSSSLHFPTAPNVHFGDNVIMGKLAPYLSSGVVWMRSHRPFSPPILRVTMLTSGEGLRSEPNQLCGISSLMAMNEEAAALEIRAFVLSLG